MGTIARFEDIEAWQRARQLTNAVYEVSGRGTFARDFPLRDQIRKASISVMSNIAEGFERGGTAEFCQFLGIAKGSAGEVRAQLYVAFDQQYIDQVTFEQVYSLADETGRMIGGFVQYLKRTNHKGTRYR